MTTLYYAIPVDGFNEKNQPTRKVEIRKTDVESWLCEGSITIHEPHTHMRVVRQTSCEGIVYGALSYFAFTKLADLLESFDRGNRLEQEAMLNYKYYLRHNEESGQRDRKRKLHREASWQMRMMRLTFIDYIGVDPAEG